MTTIKLGLSGDMHVNVPKRSEEAWRIAWWMLGDWKARGVHLIGIAGDLVDGPMTERERALLIEYGVACAEVAPTVLADGNHEIEGALRNALAGRQTKYPLIVEDGAAVHVVETTAGSVAVACVSFPKKAKLLAAAGPLSTEEVDQVTGRALQDVLRGLGVRVRELGLPSVGLVHGTIRGSKIGADDQPDRPLGLDIDLHDIALMNCDFIDVAHIHKAQHWVLPSGAIVATPSCPFYADWGEARHEKGYILAEFKEVFDGAEERMDKGLDHPWEVSWSRVPTPATPMILLETKFTEGEFEIDIPDVTGADVRLRYECPSDRRPSAATAAGLMADKLKTAGAINVKVEEIVTPTTRARIPGLSRALSLEAKLLLYWNSIDFGPDKDRTLALSDCLHELQDEAAAQGLGMGTAGRTAPAIKSVRGKGFLKFPNEFAIDFRPLGELTTIVAPNEAGKTLLMQLMGPGVLYGKTPTRGTLDDLSVAKDSFIEATFDMNGAEYVLTQNVNGMSRTGSVGLTKNGVPELSKAGRAEYKKDWADKYLLPDTVYDALICQSGTESVIDLKEGPRVELLLRVLGLEFYEVLAEKARKRATAVEAQISDLRSKISVLQGGQKPEVYTEEILRLQADVRTAEEELRLGEITLADLRAKNEEATKAKAEMDATLARVKDLEARENGVVQRIAEMKRKLDEAKVIVAEDGLINAAVESTKALQSQLAELAEVRQDLAKWNITAQAELDRLRREHARTLQERTKLQVEVVQMAGYVEAEQAAKVAEKECVRLAAEIQEAIVSLDLLTNELEVVRGEGTTTLSASRSFLRGELQYIADEKAKSPKDYAYSALVADAKAVKESEDHPAKLDQAKHRVTVADSKVKELERSRADFQRIADRLSEAQNGVARSDEAKSQIELTESALTALVGEQEIATEVISQLERKREANEKKSQQLAQEIEDLKPYADKAGLLAQAETRVIEYTDRLGDLNDEKEKFLADRCDLNDKLPAVAPIILKLDEYIDAVAGARNRTEGYRRDLSVAENNKKSAEHVATKREGFAAQIKPLEEQQANWTLLGLHLGKDALQKEEISCAGPQLTEITNDFLRRAGDTRHTVSIGTEKLHSNKKQMIPCLNIMVFDSEEGLSKESKFLSDAGKIIVGWPFNLSLITLGCERAGIKGPTIWIDEATGPCDTVNGPRCASMLRHFADRLQSQVVYIAQQPEIQALADSTISISDGGLISVS